MLRRVLVISFAQSTTGKYLVAAISPAMNNIKITTRFMMTNHTLFLDDPHAVGCLKAPISTQGSMLPAGAMSRRYAYTYRYLTLK
jgi:hypothetical protein